MKQRREFARERITGFDLRMFMIVAALTGQREIIRLCFAAAMFGNDVFDGERMRRVTRLTETVFTTSPCADDDEATQFGAGTRHTPAQEVRDPVAPSGQRVECRATAPVQPDISIVRHRTVPFVE